MPNAVLDAGDTAVNTTDQALALRELPGGNIEMWVGEGQPLALPWGRGWGGWWWSKDPWSMGSVHNNPEI